MNAISQLSIEHQDAAVIGSLSECHAAAVGPSCCIQKLKPAASRQRARSCGRVERVIKGTQLQLDGIRKI